MQLKCQHAERCLRGDRVGYCIHASPHDQMASCLNGECAWIDANHRYCRVVSDEPERWPVLTLSIEKRAERLLSTANTYELRAAYVEHPCRQPPEHQRAHTLRIKAQTIRWVVEMLGLRPST